MPQKHFLPRLEDISESSIDLLTVHHQKLSMLINDFLLRYLNSLYDEFNGDIVLAIILGELAHQNISSAFQHGQIISPFIDKSLNLESIRNDMMPCNPFSISEATGIPRETVRRKFAELLKHGWIERVLPRGYLITTLAAEHFKFGFNFQLLEGIRRLYEQMHELFDVKAPSPQE
jgi:hypothetical protein